MAIIVNGKKVAGIGPAGADGKSAYQSAVDGGFTGTEEEFNTALSELENGPFLPLDGSVGMTGVLKLNYNAPKISFYDSDSGKVFLEMASGRLYCRSMGFVVQDFATGGEGQIYGLADPTLETSAVNKRYVDGLIGNINTLLDTINGEVI